MTDVISKREFASPVNPLPRWIKTWVDDEFDQDGDLSKHCRYALLMRVVSDTEVAEDLAALCPDHRSDQHATCEQIKTWLIDACNASQLYGSKVPISPGKAKDVLVRIATLSKDLANLIFENQAILSRATSLSYLVARLECDNPFGFVKRTRGGIRAAQHSASPIELQDILETFADDLNEERTNFPTRLNALDGGQDAPLRFLVQYLKPLYKSIFGTASHVHVANMARILTGIDVSADRVRRMQSLGGKN